MNPFCTKNETQIRHMKFVVVNGRTPRPQSVCALCCKSIGESYFNAKGLDSQAAEPRFPAPIFGKDIRTVAKVGRAANAVLTAVGYNLRLILAWLRVLLCLILTALTQAFTTRSVLKSAC
jgi:hypothetical protein